MHPADSPLEALPEQIGPKRARAYRRLALTILGLDVPSLVTELQGERPTSLPTPLIDVA
jgi:hypothetical protein